MFIKGANSSTGTMPMGGYPTYTQTDTRVVRKCVPRRMPHVSVMTEARPGGHGSSSAGTCNMAGWRHRWTSTRTAWSSWWRAVSTATSSPACQCQNGRDMLQADCQSCHLHRGRWPNTPGWSVKRPAALAQPHVQGAQAVVLGVGERAPGSAPGEPRRLSRAKICSGRSPTDPDRRTRP